MKRMCLFLLAVGAATVAFGANSALAATLNFNSQTGELNYTATDNESVGIQNKNKVNLTMPLTKIAGYVALQDEYWSRVDFPQGATLFLNDGAKKSCFYDSGIPAWACPATKVTVNTGKGSDTIWVSSAVKLPTVLQGGDGYDSLTGGGGPDEIWACSANVTSCSGPGDNLFGGGGNDSLHGADNIFDKLFGHQGNDLLDGGLGADQMYGGSETDTVDYAKRTAPIVASLDGWGNDGQAGENDFIGADVEGVRGGSGNDTLQGNDSANNFWGGPGDDYLVGNGGDDYLNGQTGSDLIRPGFGKDVISGGSEPAGACSKLDTVTYGERWNPLGVSLDGIAGGANDGEAGEGDYVNPDVENVTGGSGNDTLTGNAYRNILIGGGGNDTLNGKGGGGVFESPDCQWSDTLKGEGGNDVLDGGPTGSLADAIDGGPDIDMVSYAGRTDGVVIRLDGQSYGAEDKIENAENAKGGEGNDTFAGGEGPNALFGNGGNDSLWGEGGNDNLFGGAGNDTHYGGAGNDMIAASVGDDTLDGGPGADSLSGWTGFDTVTYADYTVPVTVTIDGVANDGAAGEGDDVFTNVERVFGGHAKDKLTGNDSTNFLFGGDDADSLFGLGGSDVLNGQAGVDTVDGGADIDICLGETMTSCEK